MVAILGFLIGWAFVTGATWWHAGLSRVPTPDRTFQPADVGPRNVSILGNLAGFAVTGVVLLVSQTSNLTRTGNDFTLVLAMFVVAYMGLLSVAVQFSTASGRVRAPFDVSAAQYAGAMVGLYFIYVGWFALRPLFQAFGLTEIADITGWLLVVANLVGYPLLGVTLYRSGFVALSTTLLLPVLVVLVTIAYICIVQLFVPGGRVVDGALTLALLAFVPGAVIHGVLVSLPLLAGRQRFARVLARRWHLVLLCYAAAATVAVELLLVSILELA